jgi:hypothetical protein
MLCPDCQHPCAGGTLCPSCHHMVPEQESFRSEGGHYLRLLAGFSLFLLLLFVLSASLGAGLQNTVQRLYHSGWVWFYLIIFLIPIGIGLYYWIMLRQEEIFVTDEYIVRRSRWGYQQLAWDEITAFRQIPVLFQQTRLGRIAGLSRYFSDGALFQRLPKVRYELQGPPDAAGNPETIALDPGTVDDLPWLVQLIEERIGSPEQD